MADSLTPSQAQQPTLPTSESVSQWLGPWQQRRQMYVSKLAQQRPLPPSVPAASRSGPSPSSLMLAAGVEQRPVRGERAYPSFGQYDVPVLPVPPVVAPYAYTAQPNLSEASPTRKLEAQAAAMEEAAANMETAAAKAWETAAAEWEAASAAREAVLDARAADLKRREKLADQREQRQHEDRERAMYREGGRAPKARCRTSELRPAESPARAPAGSGATIYPEWRALHPSPTLQQRRPPTFLERDASARVHAEAEDVAKAKAKAKAVAAAAMEAEAPAAGEAEARWQREVGTPMSERSLAEVALWRQAEAARELWAQEEVDVKTSSRAMGSGRATWTRPSLDSRRKRLAELFVNEQQPRTTVRDPTPGLRFVPPQTMAAEAASAAAAAATAAHSAAAQSDGVNKNRSGLRRPAHCTVQTDGVPLTESGRPSSANAGSARLAQAAGGFGELERLAAAEAERFRHCCSPSPVPTPSSVSAGMAASASASSMREYATRAAVQAATAGMERTAAAGRVFADAVAMSSQAPARGVATSLHPPAPNSPDAFSVSNRSARWGEAPQPGEPANAGSVPPTHPPSVAQPACAPSGTGANAYAAWRSLEAAGIGYTPQSFRSRRLRNKFGDGEEAASDGPKAGAETPGSTSWASGELLPSSQRSSRLSSRLFSSAADGSRRGAAAVPAGAPAVAGGSPGGSSEAWQLELQAMALEEAASMMEDEAAKEWEAAAAEWEEAAAQRQATLESAAGDLRKVTDHQLAADREPWGHDAASPANQSMTPGTEANSSVSVCASLLSWPELSPSAPRASSLASSQSANAHGGTVGASRNECGTADLELAWPSHAESVAVAEQAAAAADAAVRATRAKRTAAQTRLFAPPEEASPSACAPATARGGSVRGCVASERYAEDAADDNVAAAARGANISQPAESTVDSYVSLSEQLGTSELEGGRIFVNPRISLAELDLSSYDARSLRDSTGDLRASVVRSRVRTEARPKATDSRIRP